MFIYESICSRTNLFKYIAPKTKLMTVLVNWNRSRVRPFICAAIHIMSGQRISTGATDILTVFKFISYFPVPATVLLPPASA
jgi:hypothetical protein